MDTTSKPLSILHEEHTDWLGRLDFYTDEIRILRERINEVAWKNTGKDILAEVEHFENQFKIQKEHIDELRHAIRDHENYIENRVNENPVASDRRKLHDHPVLRGKMETFEKLFAALRKELYAFLLKVM